MTKVLTNPITGQAAWKTITGLAKLGAFAAVSIMASKTFHSAGNEFLAEMVQSYRQVKDIASA